MDPDNPSCYHTVFMIYYSHVTRATIGDGQKNPVEGFFMI